MADEQKTKEAHSVIFDEGLKMRYKVAGKEYVDRSLKNGSSDFARPMQEVQYSHPPSSSSFRSLTHASISLV